MAEVFIEREVSGSVPLGDRPEGAGLLAALQPGDIVIAATLDRMFRSALDALNVIRDFQRQRISLCCSTSAAMSAATASPGLS